MSILSVVEGWFSKQEASFEKVFSRIEPLVTKAEPIVKELSVVVGVVSDVDKNVIITKIAGYLGTVTTDEAKVTAFLPKASTPMDGRTVPPQCRRRQ